MAESPRRVFEATCPKCGARYEMDDVPTDHPGTFCPSCRDAGYRVLGVLHWKLVRSEPRGTEEKLVTEGGE
jgi:hypothetical protein